jgi:anti-sigma factor NepR-like protein
LQTYGGLRQCFARDEDEMRTRKPGNPQSPMQTEQAGGKTGTGLGRDIQTKIGQQLRALYDDVVQEGVPDRFTELLRQLDKDSSQGKPE